MTFQLYDYQLELVDKARKLFSETDGVLIQSPPGSGKSVMIAEIVKNAALRKNRVLFIVHRRELIFQITNTLATHDVDLTQVDIYSEKKAKSNLENIKTPSIILTDETHHSRAQTYKDIYNHFDKALRLGFTATPWRASGKGFTDIYPHMVEGPSVRWLIDNQKLAPYKYKSVVLADTDKLKKNSQGDYTKKSMDDAIPKAIYGDIVGNYQKFADGQKTILYAHSVEASKAIAEKFEEQGINAVHADAKTPTAKREQIMNDFRDGIIKVLCNVDLISEGFDVPDCTCVILARPTDSLVLYMQQAMRSMRYQPDKIATIIDHVGNYARHQLPDYPHNWKKYFKGVDKKQRKADDAPSLATCDVCFTVYDSKLNACPSCGHVNETEVQESELEYKEAELTDINPFETDYTLIKYSKSNMDKSELKTLEDYYLYAKANNYKESWIKFNYPTFRATRITFPAFYAELKPIKQKYNY